MVVWSSDGNLRKDRNTGTERQERVERMRTHPVSYFIGPCGLVSRTLIRGQKWDAVVGPMREFVRRFPQL